MAASVNSRDRDNMTPATWISQYHALLQREAVLATELQQQRANPLCGLREVWEEQSGAARSQQQLRSHLFGRVQGARAKVQRLQQQLQDTRPGTTYIEALSSSIAEVESSLQSIKEAQRGAYGELVAEEHRLESELEAVAAALEEHEGNDDVAALRPATAKRAVSCDRPARSTRPPTAPAHGSSSGSTNSGGRNSSSGLLPEVLEYDAYVARHGPCGGWHEDDHRVFLNCLRHCKGDYSHAVLVAAERLPCLTRPQLVAHARWHADLTDLDMRRRVAMVAWRANREAAKAAAQAREDVVGEGAAAARQVQQEHHARDQATKSQRQQQRAALQQWREQQDALAAAAALQAQEQRRVHAEQEAAERAERQAANKAMLQQHKAAQAAAARQAAAAAAALHAQQSIAGSGLSGGRSAASLEAQARVKERSEATFARRAALMSAKEAKQRARSEAQAALLAEASAPPAARDPARLLKATAAAAARAECGGVKGERAAKESGFILHQQRVRATPLWMAPLLRQH